MRKLIFFHRECNKALALDLEFMDKIHRRHRNEESIERRIHNHHNANIVLMCRMAIELTNCCVFHSLAATQPEKKYIPIFNAPNQLLFFRG